ncbi:MAG: hypothetical protein IJ737_07335 [Ruminococcus sp.]|nr:hypothetical protein [Ruminococcus sp.]
MRATHPAARLMILLLPVLPAMFCLSLSAPAVSLFGAALTIAAIDLKGGLKALAGGIAAAALTGVINPLINRRGVTLLLFVNGRPYTLEAMLYGVQLGLSIAAAVCWLAAAGRYLDTGERLYIIGKLSPKTAMAASMALGFVPAIAGRFKRTEEAQTAGGLYGDGISDRAARSISVLSAVTAWSAESAARTARSMSARGYGLRKRRSSRRVPFRRHDAVLTALSAAVFIAMITAYALGGGWRFYPTVYSGGGAGLAFTLLSSVQAFIPAAIAHNEAIRKHRRNESCRQSD